MNKIISILASILCIIALVYSGQDSLFSIFTRPKTLDFHTPVLKSGYYLPTHIVQSLEITPTMGTVIIAGTSVIEKGAEVTIQAGTTIAVHEYGSMIVRGNLKIFGTNDLPVHFISNEAREENRTWSGIIFNPESSGTILHTIVHHASPAISCAQHTNVTISRASFTFGNLAVFGPCSYTR